nr:ATP-binding cassette domain-containing protein [Pelagibacterales bacterium]
MIKIKNISKSFDQIKVVDSISTVFEKGKTNLIIGQSGSGKTVLMKCLVGLLNFDQGEIFFDEKSFNGLNFSNLSELRNVIGI